MIAAADRLHCSLMLAAALTENRYFLAHYRSVIRIDDLPIWEARDRYDLNRAYVLHFIEDAIAIARRADRRFTLWDFQRAVKVVFGLRELPDRLWALGVLEGVEDVRDLGDGSWGRVERRRFQMRQLG